MQIGQARCSPGDFGDVEERPNQSVPADQHSPLRASWPLSFRRYTLPCGGNTIVLLNDPERLLIAETEPPKLGILMGFRTLIDRLRETQATKEVLQVVPAKHWCRAS